MDKLTQRPLSQMTREELIVAVRNAEQIIKDQQGWIDARIEADLSEGSHLPSCNGKNIAPAGNTR